MRIGGGRVNGDEPWRRIGATLALQSAWTAPGWAPRWHVLFGGRRRPMLLPVARYPIQRACLRYFIGERRAAWLARTLLRANHLLPGASLLPEVDLSDAPAPTGAVPPLGEAAYVAFQVGTPGPYQKSSALFLGAEGVGLALAKTAMAPSGDAMVKSEARWLGTLAGIGALAAQVPQLLGEGETTEGRRYLVATAAASTCTTLDFTPSHARFLGALGRTCFDTGGFRDSLGARALRRNLERLRGILPEGRRVALHDAVADCQALLADYDGPLVVSQGDFAPWNIRMHGREVFVFDWEYASEGANPLSDVLHYLLMPRALGRGSLRLRILGEALRHAQLFARQTYPEWRWRERTVSALALGYLLGVLLHFTVASGRFEARHPVIANYWQLVKERSSWMAA